MGCTGFLETAREYPFANPATFPFLSAGEELLEISSFAATGGAGGGAIPAFAEKSVGSIPTIFAFFKILTSLLARSSADPSDT